jgi:hypothetical protein
VIALHNVRDRGGGEDPAEPAMIATFLGKRCRLAEQLTNPPVLVEDKECGP